MQRIVIVGNAGSGKSTLARRLGARLALPVVSLDTLAWEPGWQAVSTLTLRARLSAAIAGDAWITDGNYALVSFDLRLPRADLFIWVERPAWACMARVLRRAVRGCFRDDEDLAAGCRERFDRRLWDRLRFIRNFDRRNRPKIEAARLQHGPDVPVVRLRGDAEIAAFLASCTGS
jgi:adenylate kinase family enzyme